MTGGLIIRLAGADDAPAVKAITDAAYAKWIVLIGRPPAPMLSNHARHVADGRVHIGILDKIPVAVLDVVTGEDCLFIDNLAVHPQWQRNGIADAMLAHAGTLCRRFGFDRIRLLTNQRFAENLDFYAKRGFTPTHEEAFIGGIAVHMMKRID